MSYETQGTAHKQVQTKHILDKEVCEAYAVWQASGMSPGFPYEAIAKARNASEKVAYAACERAYNRGLIECGVSLRTGWLTDKGKALLGGSP